MNSLSFYKVDFDGAGAAANGKSSAADGKIGSALLIWE